MGEYKLILSKVSDWDYEQTQEVPDDITAVELFDKAEGELGENQFIVSLCSETKVISIQAYDDYLE